jgi:UDP:flavonoid glycosyltransferase YjiC (YdhE family)
LEHNCAIYAISPALFPRPSYWPDNLHVLGYHERNKAIAWQPDAALLSFMQRHPKFVLVTFGSMSNPEPEKKTAVILDALQKLQIPAIVNTAGGGLIQPEGFVSDTIHFVNRIPYDYIFPKTYAVVHHGGSGTTHMALKNGCASLIVPHIIDQYLWNNIASQKGVGPKGPAITKLSAASFPHKLKDLWENTAYKEASEALAKQMAKEDFKEQLATLIEEGKASS